jgi:hypothetical protein
VKLGDKAPRVGDQGRQSVRPRRHRDRGHFKRGRDIGAGPYDDFIQIDAPVNKATPAD